MTSSSQKANVSALWILATIYSKDNSAPIHSKEFIPLQTLLGLLTLFQVTMAIQKYF